MLVLGAGRGLPQVLGHICRGRGGGSIIVHSSISSHVRIGAMVCCMTLVSISVLGTPMSMLPMAVGGHAVYASSKVRPKSIMV
jgi:hypothetical protein